MFKIPIIDLWKLMNKSYRDPELGSRLILTDQYNEVNRCEEEFFKIILNRGAPLNLTISGLNVTLEE